MDDRDLVALLLTAADSLDQREASSTAGIVRQAASRITELSRHRTRARPTCPRCGRELPRYEFGRPRVYCERCSPPEKSRKVQPISHGSRNEVSNRAAG